MCVEAKTVGTVACKAVAREAKMRQAMAGEAAMRESMTGDAVMRDTAVKAVMAKAMAGKSVVRDFKAWESVSCETAASKAAMSQAMTDDTIFQVATVTGAKSMNLFRGDSDCSESMVIAVFADEINE